MWVRLHFNPMFFFLILMFTQTRALPSSVGAGGGHPLLQLSLSLYIAKPFCRTAVQLSMQRMSLSDQFPVDGCGGSPRAMEVDQGWILL